MKLRLHLLAGLLALSWPPAPAASEAGAAFVVRFRAPPPSPAGPPSGT